MASVDVCQFNKFGYCKYQKNCHKNHENEICPNQTCEVKTCSLRHPKICRFYRDYGRCKFFPCAYMHVQVNQTYINDAMSQVITELKVLIQENSSMIENLNEKILLLSNRNYDSSLNEVDVSGNHIKSLGIPQVDGINDVSAVDEDQALYVCETCQLKFSSSQDLKLHMDEMFYACEDCGLCFGSQYEGDLHEYATHQDEYFQVNSLTPTSKMRAYNRLLQEQPNG